MDCKDDGDFNRVTTAASDPALIDCRISETEPSVIMIGNDDHFCEVAGGEGSQDGDSNQSAMEHGGYFNSGQKERASAFAG